MCQNKGRYDERRAGGTKQFQTFDQIMPETFFSVSCFRASYNDK